MSWRVAKSLEVLREQINTMWPYRSKAADGAIGDVAHASRNSDHNPWVINGTGGVVTARDFTNDPLHGLDSEKLANTLRSFRDKRIKYIISNKKISSAPDFAWRKYSGSNPHNHHFHISVKSDKSLYDSTESWALDGYVATPVKDTKPVLPKLEAGTSGLDVRHLQELLNKHGAKPPLKVDGDFGGNTKKAVIFFQKLHKLGVDGIVGPYTWELLLKGE